MNLEIKNLCKISKAEIKFDGLTIFAGENNSGKSTIGKLIFTIIKSANTYQVENQNEKIRIVKQFTNSFSHAIRRSDIDRRRSYTNKDLREFEEINRHYLRTIINQLDIIDEKIDRLQYSLLMSDYNTKVFDEIFDEIFNQAGAIISDYLLYIINGMNQRDMDKYHQLELNIDNSNRYKEYINASKTLENILKKIPPSDNSFLFPNDEMFLNMINKYDNDINKLTNYLFIYYRMFLDTIVTFEELRKANNMLSSDIQVLIDFMNKNLYKEFNSGVCCRSEQESEIILGDELFTWIHFSVMNNKVSILEYENRMIFKEAIYIESPIIMYFNRMDFANKEDLPFHITDLLYKLSIVNKRSEIHLEEIQNKITNIVNGKLEYNKESNKFVYKNKDNYEDLLNMTNVATGIKSLGILQMLNENGWLNKDSILIIDEPEVHLHPQWQLEYCKIICNLVEFGLNVIINTHSPYIVQSLSSFSKNTGIYDKTTFYLTENKKNKSIITDVTDSLSSIFEKLAKPMREIM